LAGSGVRWRDVYVDLGVFRSIATAFLFCTFALSAFGQNAVLTQHNDVSRTGQNTTEPFLTTANVNVNQFGKLFALPTDGQVFAQPLYVPAVTINGATHNVLIITTEADSVYAFDADSNTGMNSTPLWKASLAGAGEAPVNTAATIGCFDPAQTGATSTPVIDPTSNTIYVESESTDGSNYFHRLHALDLLTGNEKAPGPIQIAATVAGTGDGSTNGQLVFDSANMSLHQLARPGLLLMNGTIYIAFASLCDAAPYHGWLFAYDAATFTRTSVYVTTPNGGLGGFWMSGAGVAADSGGNIYIASGNGDFDTTNVPALETGDTLLKLGTTNQILTLLDYFTPQDQQALDNGDLDLGSGGVLLLPDQPGPFPHILVQTGKEGRIYVVNRDQLTTGNSHYCSNCTNDPEIIEESNSGAVGGMWSVPAYWNNNIYFWGTNHVLNAIPITNGLPDFTQISSSSTSLGFPGATPSISSNGTAAGTAILWAIGRGSAGVNGPAEVYAFDASNISNELWKSTQAANNRDSAGNYVKFSTTTISNGKVYVGTSSEVDVYGLLLSSPAALACPATQAQAGTPYNSSLRASGGQPPYTFSILTGSLPPGLVLYPASGAISGTPSAPGAFSFTANEVDSSRQTGTTVSCTIGSAALSVSSSNLSFTVVAGSASLSAAQPVTISSSNTIPLGNWTASVPSGSFISLSILGGSPQTSLSGSGTTTIYMVASGNLAANTTPYQSTVTITSSSANPSQQSVSVSVTVVPAGTSWPNGYNYQGTITVSHTRVPNTDQTNFPVLISGTYPALATTANGGQITNPSGYDIIFSTDPNGITGILNYEREYWSGTNGACDFWVQLPTVSHTSDTVFYIFYGNSSVATDQSNKTGVWDVNYKGVWHLPNGTTLSANDSTSNGNNGTITGATATTGKIGGGASFNSSSDTISINAAGSLSAPFTIEEWAMPANLNNLQGLFGSRTPGDESFDAKLTGSGVHGDIGNGSLWLTTSADAGFSYSANTWHHFVYTVTTSGYTIYADGSQIGSGSFSGTPLLYNSTHILHIGWYGTEYLIGSIDEVRVSNIARSANWIATEYNNENSPSTFYTVGSAQTGSSGPPPALTVSASSLSFMATSGSSNPSAQSVAISSSNSSALGSWTATASASQPWITLSTTANGAGTQTLNGSGAATIYVQVASGGLSASATPYSGTITISSPGALSSSSPQTVGLSLTVNSPPPSGSSWPNGYSYQRTIAINCTQVPNTNQTNFPLLISGTYSYLATTGNGGNVTNANGYDIIFTSDAAGTSALAFERESYNASTGAVNFWVNVPTVSNTANTVIYMFYGNSSITTDQSNPTGVWDVNYKGVWHLPNGTTLSANDSTSNGNNGTITGATATTGKIGGGASFNSSSDTISINAAGSLSAPFTIEEWAMPANLNNLQGLFGSRTPGDESFDAKLTGSGVHGDIGNGSLWLTTSADAGFSYSANTWHHFVYTVTTSGYTIYADGSQIGSGSFSGTPLLYNSTHILHIGWYGTEYLIGSIDEVRVSNIARSANWIATEYNNENSPSTFYTVGSAQTGGS